VLYLSPASGTPAPVEWPKLISKSVIFSFTAWNPNGQTAPDAANAAANARLEADLDKLRWRALCPAASPLCNPGPHSLAPLTRSTSLRFPQAAATRHLAIVWLQREGGVERRGILAGVRSGRAALCAQRGGQACQEIPAGGLLCAVGGGMGWDGGWGGRRGTGPPAMRAWGGPSGLWPVLTVAPRMGVVCRGRATARCRARTARDGPPSSCRMRCLSPTGINGSCLTAPPCFRLLHTPRLPSGIHVLRRGPVPRDCVGGRWCATGQGASSADDAAAHAASLGAGSQGKAVSKRSVGWSYARDAGRGRAGCRKAESCRAEFFHRAGSGAVGAVLGAERGMGEGSRHTGQGGWGRLGSIEVLRLLRHATMYGAAMLV
jgi:hypothetical protein